MESQTVMHQLSHDMQVAIQNCLDCHSTCLSTVTLCCLPQGGAHAEAKHVALMLDCAEMCQTCANFMLRGSALHMRTCELCAQVCDMCAMDCQRFADDDHMQACAAVCRRCAESCRHMSLSAAAV